MNLMREYSSIEEFKEDTLARPLRFRFYSDRQESACKSITKIIEDNIIKKAPISRRFSMVIYGSPGIGKSFNVAYVLKDLERAGKLTSQEYLYCKNFREEVIKEHDRLLFKYYNIKTINSLVDSILKLYLDEKDLKLVIFDNLKEKEFLDIDFTCSDFKYNCNGKGVIWILSFKEGFRSKIDESNIELLEIPSIQRNEIQIIKDRHLRHFNVNLKPEIQNINDLLKYIERKQK